MLRLDDCFCWAALVEGKYEKRNGGGRQWMRRRKEKKVAAELQAVRCLKK